jgi:hypothetical protein
MCDGEQNRWEAQHGNKDQLINFCRILGMISWKIFAPQVPISCQNMLKLMSMK